MFISGQIVATDGLIDDFIVMAKGESDVEGTVFGYDESTDSVTEQTSTVPSGYVNIQTDRLPATNFEIRAKKDIFIELENDFTVSGFIGGLEGFEKAENVDIKLRNGRREAEIIGPSPRRARSTSRAGS